MCDDFAQESLFYVENSSATPTLFGAFARVASERRSLGQRLGRAAGARHRGDLLQRVNLRVVRDAGGRGQDPRGSGMTGDAG